jgi:hypothetical protein
MLATNADDDRSMAQIFKSDNFPACDRLRLFSAKCTVRV